MGGSVSVNSLNKGDSTESNSPLVGRGITKGCNLIIEDEKARAAFMNYIIRREWVEQLSSGSKGSGTAQEYRQPEGSTLADFEAKFASSLLTETTTPDDYYDSDALLTPLLLATVFPLFLKSRDYEDWVLSQTSGSDNSAAEEARRIARLKELFTAAPSTIDPTNLSNRVVVDALKAMDAVELNKVMEAGTWLDSLVSMVEHLPLPVSVATARGGHGFPLIYVNKAFERMSGYDRSEIIGHNCKFLQSSRTETGQVRLLSEALRLAKPVKVALTNVRKDGTDFGNLLAMKPVFDGEGVYSYVVGVQCDISDPSVAHRTIRTVEDLLTILPNILE